MSFNLQTAILADLAYKFSVENFDSYKDHVVITQDGSSWTVLAVNSPTITDYQGALIKNNDTGAIAFVNRGTASLRDALVVDLGMAVSLTNAQAPAMFEFFNSPAVTYALASEGKSRKDIIIVGHSLGGALSLWALKQEIKHKVASWPSYALWHSKAV